MRMMGILVALLTLGATCVWAQQELAPSTDDGPLIIHPAAAKDQAAPPASTDAPVTATEQPQPVGGVYNSVPGVVLPRLMDAERLIYPADAPAADLLRICNLSMVVGTDGIPAEIKVVHSLNSVVDRLAMDAAGKLRFEPGTVADKPVPVRIEVRYRFIADYATPQVVIRRYTGTYIENKLASRTNYKPPTPIYAPNAEFSEQARAAKFNGVVVISVMVTEDGLPTDIQVSKSVGMGLDEKAVESVSRYRFKPATKDGKAVSARVTVEVNFHFF